MKMVGTETKIAFLCDMLKTEEKWEHYNVEEPVTIEFNKIANFEVQEAVFQWLLKRKAMGFF